MAAKEKINLLDVIPCRSEYVHLEEHGTVVWELIDGKQTVREIIEKLAVHFQNEAGYESRVSTYLYQLQKDGFIKFHFPTE